MSYHQWRSLAKCKGAEGSVVWVTDIQVGVEGNHENMDDEKLNALPESKSVKLASSFADVARFGEAALEAAKNFLEDNKVID